jgi:diguanylate cyclase (GGDEF)-like protein
MKQNELRRQRILEVIKIRDLLTAFALTASLLVTYRAWQAAYDVAEQAVRTTFDFRVRESYDRIQERLLIYEQVLRAARGLFEASDSVSRESFRSFANSLSLSSNYPGIQGIGFSMVVPPDQKQRHETNIRGQGFPQYQITPEGRRDFYTSVVYLEPFSGVNLIAFGYDMYSEPNRRAAMERARDTGAAAVSARVVLVQEQGEASTQPGFLMYLPVYRKDVPHATLEERRKNLQGWVYAPFRMYDFMYGVYGERASDLDIEIYDGGETSGATLMYDSDPSTSALNPQHKLRRISQVEAGDHTWTVAAAISPQFETSLRSDRPQIILQAGISISFMVGFLTWLFLDDRARVLQAAHQAMQLALYDPLTGLPNRKLLDERLQQALSMAKRERHHVALLFIDLDKFKPVNDKFGHAYGDLLLKEVGKRLQSCMRESDTACRLGGDEFVALLPDVGGREAAMAVSAKIADRLAQPYKVAGQICDISASIGVAVYPEDGVDSRVLMKHADLAMYDAKSSGAESVKPASSARSTPVDAG